MLLMSIAVAAFPLASGIYRIWHVDSGKSYIGSSVTLRRRIRDHFRDLRAGAHANPKLQRAWNAHGEDAFRCEVVELDEKSQLTKREQFYIDSFHAIGATGFNVVPRADRREMSTETRERIAAAMRTPENRELMRKYATGRKHSDEAKAKVSAAARGRKHSASSRSKMSALRIGMKFSDEHRRNIAAARARQRPFTKEEINRRSARVRATYASLSDERLLPMRTARLGLKSSAEHCAKISAANRGRKFSEEHKAALRAAWAKRKSSAAAAA